MAEHRRLLDDAQAGERAPSLEHLPDRFGDVVDVALRVDPARDGEPHELARAGVLAPARVATAEHQRPELAAPDAGVNEQLAGERLTGERERRQVGSEAGGVDVDGVAAARADDGRMGSITLIRKGSMIVRIAASWPGPPSRI